ncbi:hypothetical protein [Methanosphaerula palustris]|jgi:hypothetical protein|uniref:Uncharacterized protein n=1 Tax=Methanosphaerula palustris (strain ATCC BAA-1556 / DSM 19958 / E1-9c) TaxID=521011 RepID=B8GEE5_METPE|nr:hypothetical protein [Methanosphaerula palustris]ACL17646.1 conserved hypothetical protein [Methanosphaerula palustris E1-9c]
MVEEAELYDIIIPPGVPRSIITDVVKKFDVELADRRERISFANMDGDEREVLAFRGTKPVLEEVEAYVRAELIQFIGE